MGRRVMALERIVLHQRIHMLPQGMGRERALFGICSVFSENLAGRFCLA